MPCGSPYGGFLDIWAYNCLLAPGVGPLGWFLIHLVQLCQRSSWFGLLIFHLTGVLED